jgi:hypothetical protein
MSFIACRVCLTTNINCKLHEWLQTGFGLVNTFTDHLYSRLSTKTITRPPLISTIHTSPQHPLSLFPVWCLFTSRTLTTASNIRDSSVSRTQVIFSRPPVHNWSEICPLLMVSLHEPHRKHPVSNSIPIVVCVLVDSGTSLPSRCTDTVVVYTQSVTC